MLIAKYSIVAHLDVSTTCSAKVSKFFNENGGIVGTSDFFGNAIRRTPLTKFIASGTYLLENEQY